MNDSIALILSDLGEAVTALLSESIKGGLAGKARLRNGTVTWAGVLGPSGNSDYNCKAGGRPGAKIAATAKGFCLTRLAAPLAPSHVGDFMPRSASLVIESLGIRFCWFHWARPRRRMSDDRQRRVRLDQIADETWRSNGAVSG